MPSPLFANSMLATDTVVPAGGALKLVAEPLPATCPEAELVDAWLALSGL